MEDPGFVEYLVYYCPPEFPWNPKFPRSFRPAIHKGQPGHTRPFARAEKRSPRHTAPAVAALPPAGQRFRSRLISLAIASMVSMPYGMDGLSWVSTTMLYPPPRPVKSPMLWMRQPCVARGSQPFLTCAVRPRGAPAVTPHRWEGMTWAIRSSA